MKSKLRAVLLLSLGGIAFSAAADTSFRIEPLNCQGRWQLWVGTYEFTEEDRRNYYWIQRSTSVIFQSFSDFAGTYEGDSNCVAIGLGNYDLFRAKGCLNDGMFCNGANYTSASMAVKRSCRANP